MFKTHCPQGHPYDDFNTYTSPQGFRQCKSCRNERMQKRREGDKRVGRGVNNSSKTQCPQGHPYDEVNTYVNPQGRRWCRTCSRANGNRQTIKKYGISVEQFNKKLEEQDGKCAICAIVLTKETAMCVDHDHSCCPTSTACGGCVRGILCHPCNIGLGGFKDDINYLQAAIRYLSANM